MTRWALAFVLGLGAGFWGGTYVAVRAGAWATPEPVIVERWVHPPHSAPAVIFETPLTPEEARRLAEAVATTTTIQPDP